MKKIVSALVLGSMALCAMSQSDVIVSTDAYRWQGDSIIQGEFSAWAVSPEEIHSTYHGRPGYFMPVDQVWKRKNDLSEYPRLETSNKLLKAVYNMGLDEMVNAVEPDTTLRTGKEWAGVWTRDVSYSIILSMAVLQPEAAMISLRHKVNAEGQIVQDTGSGGAWPISTDRMVWALAAWEVYKVTGDKDWLQYAYPIVERSLYKDINSVYSPQGLVMGETSFIDWREQSYPKWMQTADITVSEAMSTNVVHAAAMAVASEMAQALGKKDQAALWKSRADELAEKINKTFWMDDKGYYGMYTYGRDHKVLNPRAETLGESLAILYDIAPAERRAAITENHPVTPFGTAIFFPQIADMPNYHNNALWPFVGSYWALANAKAGNEQGTLEAIGAVVRPAALFATNKENFNLDNGDYFTELNSSNMLWSLSGNLALTQKILFGINYEKDGLRFSPFVPRALADTRTLSNYPYRSADLSITVSGYGDAIKSITLNGKPVSSDGYIPARQLKGKCTIDIVMNDAFTPMKINRTPNVKAPLTPIARLTHDETLDGEDVPVLNLLEWNPIEYIGHYVILKDGERIGETHRTSWPATTPGEWQVIGVSTDGVESFASEPLTNALTTRVQMPVESVSAVSTEISYHPAERIEGFSGEGFMEIDHNTAAIEIPVDIAVAGNYTVSVRYANGNGPVNTENKATVRSLLVDGEKVGTLVMPHRGVANWNDWGISSIVPVNLTEGDHTLSIEFLPEDENMNLATNHALIDALIIRKVN